MKDIAFEAGYEAYRFKTFDSRVWNIGNLIRYVLGAVIRGGKLLADNIPKIRRRRVCVGGCARDIRWKKLLRPVEIRCYYLFQFVIFNPEYRPQLLTCR